MWRISRNIYTNMYICISLDGLMSDWFPIKQSVRQGGVLSAWLYIIYVNELLVELEKRSLGTYIHNTFYGSPMQADDLALLSICKQDLDNMIKTYYEYSIKWRYTLNPNKTVITVFRNSGNGPSKSEPRRTWSLGDNTISEQAWYKHDGILLFSNLRTVERTLTACRKLRGTFVSIVEVGLHPHSMNPITGRKNYERIVLPSALYGCLLWSDLTRTEIKMLETAHKFCLKCIQGLHPNTRTATCLALLCIGSIESLVDMRKLLDDWTIMWTIIGRLCNCPSSNQAKHLFFYRLTSSDFGRSKQIGFIRDISDQELISCRQD